MATFEKAGLFLARAQERLESMTPESWIAPDRDTPTSGEFVGSATEYQRALETLLRTIEAEHEALHAEIGLDFGAHRHLPIGHQTIHAVTGIISQLLTDDLTNEFGNGKESHYVFDRDWNVYRVYPTIRDRLSAAWRELIRT